MEVDKKLTSQGESEYLQCLLNEAAEIPMHVDANTPAVSLPEWYDDVKFKRAQQYFKDNIFAMMVAKLCGLLTILTIPSILNVLVHTNQSSTTFTAYRRYVATVMHTFNWYYEDLLPRSSAWKSIVYVKNIHSSVSKEAKSKRSDMSVSQKDMAITQFGFIGYIVLNYKNLGVQYNKEDMEAFIHFWRVISHMLGMEQRFNACTDSLEETELRLRVIGQHILKPALISRPEKFVHMGKALMEGLWCMNPFIDFDAFMFLIMRFTNVPGYSYWLQEELQENTRSRLYEQFNWYSRFILYFALLVHEVLLNFAVIRWYFNTQMYITRYLIEHFPFLAFYKFGFQNTYVRILK